MRRGAGWLLIVGGVAALWVGGTVGSDARDRGDSPPYWAWQCLTWGVLGLVIGLFLKADSPADPILDTVDRLARLAAWCRRWGAVGASLLWEGRRWWAADAPDDGARPVPRSGSKDPKEAMASTKVSAVRSATMCGSALRRAKYAVTTFTYAR